MLAPRIESLLSNFTANDLWRQRHIVEERDDNFIIIDGKRLINFCSNDYLNISTHPKVKKAFSENACAYGLGSGASAHISGFSKSHHLLEEAFAEFLNRDRAILFNSGYHANLGVISTFANRNTIAITDKLCHASLIDGVILSRAKHLRYRHNDIHHAEQLLQKNPTLSTLLITESVFSMQGNITAIKTLSTLAKKYKAQFIVDDAHGIGWLGAYGKGICEYSELSQNDVPCLITPLGKALGSFGAIVSGSKHTIDALAQFARTYRYSTALPPAICTATLAALNIIKTEPWRRQKLLMLVKFFVKEAKTRNINLVSDDITPIKCIITASNKIALAIQTNLAQKGLFVSCIRPPTVPEKTSRIRISLNYAHSEQDILHLLNSLTECDDAFSKRKN